MLHTTQTTKAINNTDITKIRGMNPGARERQAFPPSYKTPAVLLIVIVKSGKCIVGDRWKDNFILIGIKHHFQQYSSKILAVSFMDEGNRCSLINPQTCWNKRQAITNGQSGMDNPEKLATQDDYKQNKPTTLCVGHHYAQANTNDVKMHEPTNKQLEVKTNRTSFLCNNHNEHHNANRKTQWNIYIRTTQKIQRWGTRTPPKPRKTLVLAKDKHILLLIRHHPCYS